MPSARCVLHLEALVGLYRFSDVVGRFSIERLQIRIPTGAAGEFSSPGLTLCADSYSVSVPSHPRVTAMARNRPRSFCQSAGDRLHLNTHTPFTQRSRSGLTMPLSRHGVGTYQETSSHATRQATLGYSRLSSLNHCGLVLV